MLKAGLVDEVKKLKEMGFTKDMVSMQGLGYKELLSYLDGEISYGEAVRILKRDTRHFAKRQITWFKRERQTDWLFLDGKTEEEAMEELAGILLQRGLLS